MSIKGTAALETEISGQVDASFCEQCGILIVLSGNVDVLSGNAVYLRQLHESDKQSSSPIKRMVKIFCAPNLSFTSGVTSKGIMDSGFISSMSRLSNLSSFELG